MVGVRSGFVFSQAILSHLKMDVDLEETLEGAEINSDDSENEEELEVLALALENQIKDNVFSYQSHVNLINVLKQLADLDRLRLARNRMAKQFPLTSELWIEWLEDEIKIASTAEEKKVILELFERAVQDYLCIDIWLKYLQFVKEMFGHENNQNVAEVRKVCESSLIAGGLHVTKGSLLWDSYIDYEKNLSKMFENDPNLYLSQLKLIANLYKRLLSCPLMDIEKKFEEFISWLDQQTEDHKIVIVDRNLIENIYKKSNEKLLKIKIYEDALISDPEQAIDHYKGYLEHEKSKSGSPIRVQSLYERMISDFCLHEEVWLEYINFMNNVLKNGDVAIQVIRRSLRNCPWSFRLHQCHIHCLEKFHHSHQSVTSAFEDAVASGLQTAQDFREIWMTYLEYLRRRFDEPEIPKEEESKRLDELRANFSKALEFLMQLDDADPEFVITQYWARIEANYCKNLEKTRSLWNDILSVDANKTSDMWLEYIGIERAFGDSKHLKKLFPRALQSTRDFPEKIANFWLNYERDEGTLESYENCLSKIKLRLDQVKEQREREEAKKRAEKQQAQEFPSIKSKRHGLGYKKENANSEKSVATEKSPGFKRKLEEREGEEESSPQKKTRKEENEDLVNKLLEESNKSHGVTVTHDSSKDDRTVFVSNLDFLTEESAIREALEPCGKITDLRLVKDYKGRSKGYCYVEFEKPSSILKALRKDRELINGRPMFVSRCDPDKETRGKIFKYSSAMEKNKLFVRGLPYTTTEDDLRELFGKHGTLKDVRLVTYRNGHSKGLAYVDYEDEVSAAQAILKIDGTTIRDRQISVAISNPPERKTETIIKPVNALGGGPKELGPRGRGRTQISFLPRSVQLNSTPQATESMANLSLISPVTAAKPKLSNSDFRTMIS